MTQAAGQLRRQEYSSERYPEVMDFVRRFPAMPAARCLGQLFLEKLISGPQAVIDVFEGQERVAIAAVIDTCRNVLDSASVNVLGIKEPGNCASVIRFVLDEAEREVGRGPRSSVAVGDDGTIPELQSVLRSRSYEKTYEMFTMDRAAGLPIPEARVPLPGKWRWTRLSEPLMKDYYHAVAAAFANLKGSNIPDYESFVELRRESRDSVRLLLDDHDKVMGFVRVAPDSEEPSAGRGEVSTIGRVPACRGLGLGDHLLREALLLLESQGFKNYCLHVNVENEKALELYRGFGFTVRSTVSVYGLKVKEPST